MISADYARTLFAYNAWAAARLLKAAAGMAPEELDAAPIPACGSLRAVFAHTIGAEEIWRRRWEGEAPTGFLSPADLPTVEAITARWEDEQRRWQAHLAHLADETLLGTLSYKNLSGAPFHNPLWQTIVHLANHGTQHRSEIAAMLTALGRSPGDLDMIVYFRSLAG